MAIKQLDKNKSCGLDGIYAGHLKYASTRLLDLLSHCFSSLLVHGVLPDSMISVVLLPVIKDKAGNITSKDNYRPIALASIVSKVMEIVLLNRMSEYISTRANQFGFKKKHSTDQCIYVMKEIIDTYRALNGSMFVRFLDASKAFDRVNHTVLFNTLIRRGVPSYIVRILIVWYENQRMCVRWGNVISESFGVSNGVRQGGIFSPYLFNVYVDNLSSMLNKCNVGCYFGRLLVNHIMYADDLVLLSLSVAGLSKLLQICERFGDGHYVQYNPKKSAVMTFRASYLKGVNLPTFKLNDVHLKEVDSIKYLGHIVKNDLTDDLDIERQCRQLYAQGNMILRKFYMCDPAVKMTLFHSYCLPCIQLNLKYSTSTGQGSKPTGYKNCTLTSQCEVARTGLIWTVVPDICVLRSLE